MGGPGSRFKGKHSLDSDEEDEGDEANSVKYNILDSDDVEGMSCHRNRLGMRSTSIFADLQVCFNRYF